MNVERALVELREAQVPEGAVERAVIAIQQEKPAAKRRLAWLTPAMVTALVLALVLWPWKREDQVWAAAIRALKDAKCIHIRLVKRLEIDEIWKKDDKTRRVWKSGEVRNNGLVIAARTGTRWVTGDPKRPWEVDPVGTFDLDAFNTLANILDGKSGPRESYVISGPVSRVVNGRRLSVYTVHAEDIYQGTSPVNTNDSVSSAAGDTHTSTFFLKAFVDPDVDRIVRVDQTDVFEAKAPKQLNGSSPVDNFIATIDYPADLPDSMFDPPVGVIRR
jgi:hypothetical protein